MTRIRRDALAIAVLGVGCLYGAHAWATDYHISLSGANEVPPVNTMASGMAMISVADDGMVTGSIELHGIDGTMAHIHQGAPGVNGPVIVKFVKEGAMFKMPKGSRLDAAQMAALKAGDLYVNVHSQAHQGGEIRGQMTTEMMGGKMMK